MRNDSEHILENTGASRRRGALADAPPHRPRLTVSRKLWLGFGVLLLLLIVGGIVIEQSIRTIDANLKEITEIEEPESAAAFEMEISLIGTGLAVLEYLDDRDPAHLVRIEDDAIDFARSQQQFHELTLRAENETELNLSARIDAGYTEFTSLAGDLIALEDVQFEKAELFRQNLDQMDVILDEQILASLDPSDLDSDLKLQAAYEMEINANGIAKELENYLRTHDSQYERRVHNNEADFERSITMYESLGFSSQERQGVDDLRILFDDSVALANEIIDLEKAKAMGLANFIQLRGELDILFDDEIRAVAQAELAEAKAEAERSVDFAQWVLLALLIAGLGGGGVAIIIGRGISKPLGKLAAGVEHVSRGDLSHVIDVDSSDEIGELAAAFNRMTTNLALITASRDELDEEIEERKRMEEALQASEAYFRAFFENAQDIFFQTDINGIIVEISPSVERHGYTREGIIGTSVLEIYENPAQRAEMLSKLIREGELRDYEIQLKAADGHVIDVSLNAHSWYDSEGERVGIEGSMRDITQRKRMEEALRESEAKYRTIFENVRDTFYQTDMQGIIVEISPSVERFGYTREGIIGTQVLDIYENPEDRSALVKTILEHGEVLDYELRLKTGDGGVTDASISAHLLRDEDGTAVGIEGVLRDITERKQAEETLARSLETERERARRDPLTGVLNHGAIAEALREACAAAENEPLAVAMVDLDGLKAINDTYGHQVGDEALTIVANVLARDHAVVGRYGGDEFIVVLPGADRAEAERYRDAVTAKLLDARLPDPETGVRIPVVASWGLAVFPEEAETIADLIHLSDSAMYAAKRQRPISPDGATGSRPLGNERAAQMVGEIVPLLTSPGKLNDKLRLVSHRLSVGAGYDAVDFSLFAPEPGTPLAQNTFAEGPNDLLETWTREQRNDSPEPHPIRLLFERTPRPVILNDPWNDELLLKPQRDILRAAQLRSVLVAPMIWRDQVIGSLGVASKQEAAFSADDAQFVGAVSTQVTAIMHMETLVDELQASTDRLSHAHKETVLLLAAAAEAHDHTTGLHLQSVRDLTETLARELGYAEADVIALGLASVLHDIGKIRVPDAILTSPAKLEAGQWEIMKQHTIWGADFLSGHQGFELAATVALHHHEHCDGGGYPGGIAGDAIPEAATIVAVADAFDAITHNRPYRNGRSVDEAVAEIAAHSGKQFSPKVVAALERLHQRNELSTVYPEVIDTETAA